MIPVVFIVVVALSGVHGQASQKNCPPVEDVKPCVCKDAPNMLADIHCDHLPTVGNLLDILKRLKGYSLSEMVISNSSIGKLPSNAFQGVLIKSLVIKNSTVTTFGDSINRPPFLGLEKCLNMIKIQGIFQNETLPLKFLSLFHLKRLEVLVITKNIVPEIGNDWFESGPYDLKELYFTDSSTKILGSHSFASLTELKTLSVTGGSIKSITREMFPKPALHLESLDLSKNNLDSLPTDIFAHMPSLEIVYLDSNAIMSIDELTWSPVWHQLIAINLLENPLNCDVNLKWIYQYRLPDILQGNCAKPSNLKGKDLEKLTLAAFS